MTIKSSWIRAVRYLRGNDGSSYLAIFTDTNAMLYAGIPPWIPGLLKAGTGKRSVGHAYRKLVRGKYLYNRVEGAALDELKKICLNFS